MDHVIEVGVSKSAVRAEPNPLPSVAPGDTVTWLFHGQVAERDLKVVFKDVEAVPGSGSTPRRHATKSPFRTLSTAEGRVFGTVSTLRKARFIYDVFDGETKLDWINRLDGHRNFGGLEVPEKPVRG